MHGFKKNRTANLIDRGYSAEAIEDARRLLIQTYYQTGFARYSGDPDNSSPMTKTTIYVSGCWIKWVVVVCLNAAMPEEGACVMEEKGDGKTEIIIGLSHDEMRDLWKKSRH